MATNTVGTGGDYSTLALWEAARQSSTDATERAELLGQTHTTGCTLSGWTGSATLIQIVGQTPHNGDFSASGAAVLAVDNTERISVHVSTTVEVEDIIFRDANPGLVQGFNGGVWADGSTGTTVTIRRCIAHDWDVGYGSRFVNVESWGAGRVHDITIENCIIDVPTGTTNQRGALVTTDWSSSHQGTVNWTILGCTFHESGLYKEGNGTSGGGVSLNATVRGCLIESPTGADFFYSNGGNGSDTIDVLYSLTDESSTTLSGYASTTTGTSTSVTFNDTGTPSSAGVWYTDAANDDYSLQDDANNLAIDHVTAGTMPSDDIVGATRDSSPDAGAFEVVSGGPSPISATITTDELHSSAAEMDVVVDGTITTDERHSSAAEGDVVLDATITTGEQHSTQGEAQLPIGATVTTDEQHSSQAEMDVLIDGEIQTSETHQTAGGMQIFSPIDGAITTSETHTTSASATIGAGIVARFRPLQNITLYSRTVGEVYALFGHSYAEVDVLWDELNRISCDSYPFAGIQDYQTPPSTTSSSGNFALGSLPTTVSTPEIEATIDLDGTVGPYLSQVQEVSSSFVVNTASDTGSFSEQGDLWEIDVRDRDGYAYRVCPSDASADGVYCAYDTYTLDGGEEADVMEWRHVRVGTDAQHPPENDRLWVRIAVIKPASGNGVQFAGWCGREEGASCRIEKFVYPKLLMEAFSGGSGTARENAYRQRVVVDSVFAATNSGALASPPQSNHSLGALAQSGLKDGGNAVVADPGSIGTNRSRAAFHPMTQMRLGFAATGACNPADASSYLKTLMLMAREATNDPWWKSFEWRVPLQTAATGTHLLEMKWGHLPHFSCDWAIDVEGLGRRFHAPYENEAAPRWIPEIQLFTATSPAWWMDACVRYREYYEALRSPSNISTNPNISRLRKGAGVVMPSIYLGISSFEPETTPSRAPDDMPIWEASIDQAYHIWQYLQRAEGVVVEGLRHFQHWSFKYLTVHSVEVGAGDVFPVVRRSLPRLREVGLRSSAYCRFDTQPKEAGWVKDVIDAKATRERPGRLVRTIDADRKVFLTRPDELILNSIYRWSPFIEELVLQSEQSFVMEDLRDTEGYVEMIQKLVREAGLTSIYIDTYAGSFAPTTTPGSDEAWGTNKLCSRRMEVVNKIRGRGRGVTGTDFAVMSEAVTEWMEDLDWAGFGSQVMPFLQTVDWEDGYWNRVFAILPGSAEPELTDPPYVARDPSPPLWQAVHNRWNPGSSYATIPTLNTLATSSLVALNGLTQSEWLAMHCYAFASAWIQGSHQMLYEISDNQDNPPIIDNEGTPNTALDPSTSVGPQLMEFLRDELLATLSPTYAGAFLINADMQAPFDVDYSSARVTKVSNPGTPLSTTVYSSSDEEVIGGLSTENGFNRVFFSTSPDAVADFYGPHDVPAVLHSVWQVPGSPNIGMVVVNWTSSPAEWEGTLHKDHYPGVSGLVVGVELDRDGTTTALTGSFSGSTGTVGTDPGSDISLGASLPARSVRVFLFS